MRKAGGAAPGAGAPGGTAPGTTSAGATGRAARTSCLRTGHPSPIHRTPTEASGGAVRSRTVAPLRSATPRSRTTGKGAIRCSGGRTTGLRLRAERLLPSPLDAFSPFPPLAAGSESELAVFSFGEPSESSDSSSAFSQPSSAGWSVSPSLSLSLLSAHSGGSPGTCASGEAGTSARQVSIRPISTAMRSTRACRLCALRPGKRTWMLAGSRVVRGGSIIESGELASRAASPCRGASDRTISKRAH